MNLLYILTMICITLGIAGGDRCLKFQYHMYGANIDTLIVFAGTKSQPANVWERSGNQGNQWSQGEVNIPDTADLLVRFFVIYLLIKNSKCSVKSSVLLMFQGT